MPDFEQLAASAHDARARGQPLPSPCVQVCLLNERMGWCEGCFRRLDEIGGWSSMQEDAKWAVWQRIGERRRAALDATPRTDTQGQP